MKFPEYPIFLRNNTISPYLIALSTTSSYAGIRDANNATIYRHVSRNTWITIPATKMVAVWSAAPPPYHSRQNDDCQQGEILSFSCVKSVLYELDVRAIASLLHLDCSNNELEWIHFTGPSGGIHTGPKLLRTLKCSHNRLRGLQLNNLPNLQVLDCSHNQIEQLEFKQGANKLKRLDCSTNYLTRVNLGQLPFLQTYKATLNRLTIPKEMWMDQQ